MGKKEAVSVLILLCTLCVHCRTLEPISETDVKAELILHRNYIKEKAEYDVSALEGSWGTTPAGAVLFIPVWLTEVTVNLFQGCDVYVCPEDYKKRYTQQIYWGRNILYLPAAFMEKGGELTFQVKGSYDGSWSCLFVPGRTKQILLQGDGAGK